MKKRNVFNIQTLLFLAFTFFNCSNANTQQDCKFLGIDIPNDHPKYYYEFGFWEDPSNKKDEANLLFISKSHVAQNGTISFSQTKRRVQSFEIEALKKDPYKISTFQVFGYCQYDDKGRIQSVRNITKDSIPLRNINYSYPNDKTVEIEYQVLLKEEMNQRTVSEIENCKIKNTKVYDTSDRLVWIHEYESDLIMNNTVHHKGGNTHKFKEFTNIKAKDKKGNWIEKTIKKEDDDSYRHSYRYIVYDSTQVYYSTLDDLVNEFLEAFKSGNFDTIKKHGLMGKEDYLYLCLESETSILDKYIRLLYSKGEDFFHSTLVSEFVNFRLRKSLDWSNVTLKDTNLDIRKNGFHPINKEAARVELRFTDGNRTTSYRLNAIHLPSGWKYFYIK